MERKREIQTMKKINIRKPKLIYIISKDHQQQHIQDLFQVIQKKNIQKRVQSSTITLQQPPSDKLQLRFVVVDNKSGRIVLGEAFTSKAMIIVGYPEKGTNINNFYCTYPQQVVQRFLSCDQYAYQLSRRFEDTLSRDQSLAPSKHKIMVKSVACLGFDKNTSSMYKIPQAKKMLVLCSKKDGRQFIQMTQHLANKYEKILITYSRGQFLRFCEESSIQKKYLLATQYSISILRSFSRADIKILLYCYGSKTCLKMTSSRQLPENVQKLFTDFDQLKKEIRDMNFTRCNNANNFHQREQYGQQRDNRKKKITWAVSNHSSKKRDINQFSKTIEMLDDFIIQKSTKQILPQPNQNQGQNYISNSHSQRHSRNLQPSITRILEQQHFSQSSQIEQQMKKKYTEQQQKVCIQNELQSPMSNKSCKSNKTNQSKRNYKIFRVVSSNKKKMSLNEKSEKKKINFQYGMMIHSGKRSNIDENLTSNKKEQQGQSEVKINQSFSIQSQQNKTLKISKAANSQIQQRFQINQQYNSRIQSIFNNHIKINNSIKAQQDNDHCDTPLLIHSNNPTHTSKQRSFSHEPIMSTLNTESIKIKRKLIMKKIPTIEKIINIKHLDHSRSVNIKKEQQQVSPVLKQLTNSNSNRDQREKQIETTRVNSHLKSTYLNKKKSQKKNSVLNNQVFMVHQDLYLSIVPYLLQFITIANKILPHYTQYELIKQIEAQAGKKKIFVFTQQDFQRIIRGNRQKIIVVQFNNEVNTPINSGKNVTIYKDFAMFRNYHFPRTNNLKDCCDGSDTETFQTSRTKKIDIMGKISVRQ